MSQLKALTLFIILSITAVHSHATLLTEDQYITVHHQDLDNNIDIYLDWTWASSFSVQKIAGFSGDYNELYAPDGSSYDEHYVADYTSIGWREAQDWEFALFEQDVTLSDFKLADTYKNSFSVYNKTDFPENPNGNDFNNDQITNKVTQGSYALFSLSNEMKKDTFYVRTTPQESTPIPEPLSLILFATALMLLSQRWNKKIN